MPQRETLTEFLISIGIDPSGVDRGLREVTGRVRNGLTSLVSSTLVPALAGLASADFVKQISDEVMQIDRLSKALGMNAEELQAWQTAAQNAGVQADEVGEIFADFNDWMTDALNNEGGALYTEGIEQGLLPAVTDVNGQLKDTEQYILEVSDAFKAMGEQQASGLARRIGIGNLQMANWLGQGGDALREQIHQAKELGTYTQEDVKAAQEFTKTINQLTHTMKMALMPVFRAVTPLISKLGEAFIYINKHIIALAPALIAVGTAAAVSAAGGITAMKVALAGAAKSALAFIFSPWGAALAALLAIGLVLEDFYTWLEGGESAFGDFYQKIFGDPETVKQQLNDFWNTVKDVFTRISDTVEGVAGDINLALATLVALLTPMMVVIARSLGTILTPIFNVLKTLAGFLPTVLRLFVSSIGTIIRLVGMLVGFLVGTFGAIPVAIAVALAGIGVLVYKNWDAIVSTVTKASQTVYKISVAVFTALSRFFTTVLTGISSIFSSVFGFIGDTAKNALTNLANAIDSFVAFAGEAFASAWDSVATFTSQAWDNISNSVLSALSGLGDRIKNTLDNIIKSIKDKIAGIDFSLPSFKMPKFSLPKFEIPDVNLPKINIPSIKMPSVQIPKIELPDVSVNGILNAFASVQDGARNSFNDVKQIVASALSDVASVINNGLNSARQTVASVLLDIVSVFNNARANITDIVNAVSAFVVSNVQANTENVVALWQGALQTITSILNSLQSVFNSIWQNIVSIISSASGAISGFISAMQSAFNDFVSSVVSGASAIISAITDILNKCVELAKNSVFGKLISGGLDFVANINPASVGGGGNTSNDNSQHQTNITINGAGNNYQAGYVAGAKQTAYGYQ